jgi:hypothetical protein
MEKIKNCDVYFKDPKKDNILNIGLVSTLEYMVETTFYSDKNKTKEIIEHFCQMENEIFRWRSIKGDGNCYYRAVIFALLEKIILEKNIDFLKKLALDIDKFLNPDNENLKYLSSQIQSELISLNKNIVLKIFYLLIEILENKENKDTGEICYEILIKCFNFCKSFDVVMIYLMRYMLFVFIKCNKGKLYTKDFAINIGNLLPSDYETSDGGNFLYL